MSELLKQVLAAHGGMEQWRSYREVRDLKLALWVLRDHNLSRFNARIVATPKSFKVVLARDGSMKCSQVKFHYLCRVTRATK
jgi:hypothetical protein